MILLNNKMLDLRKTIDVYTITSKDGKDTKLHAPLIVMQNLNIQTDTLNARGDPNYVISAAFTYDPTSNLVVQVSDIFNSFF